MDLRVCRRSYSLAFTPLYGRWSDIFGRKVVLITSLGIFMLFSLACALSQTMIQVCCPFYTPILSHLNSIFSSSCFAPSKALAVEVGFIISLEFHITENTAATAIITMVLIMCVVETRHPA